MKKTVLFLLLTMFSQTGLSMDHINLMGVDGRLGMNFSINSSELDYELELKTAAILDDEKMISFTHLRYEETKACSADATKFACDFIVTAIIPECLFTHNYCHDKLVSYEPEEFIVSFEIIYYDAYWSGGAKSFSGKVINRNTGKELPLELGSHKRE